MVSIGSNNVVAIFSDIKAQEQIQADLEFSTPLAML